YDYARMDEMERVDVISPTWLDVFGADGKVTARADAEYMGWARGKGLKVWPRLGNDMSSPSVTGAFLGDMASRDRAIGEVMDYAAIYGFDGINIDYENIFLKDRDAFTRFVRELSAVLRHEGLTASVCVGIPDGSDTYSRCYDFGSLGEAADYVALMAYDQHWATSPVAGSTSEYAWVERSLRRTLEMVPAEKLLLGLALYTRLWRETESEDGSVTAESAMALTVRGVGRVLAEHGPTPVWDTRAGQRYAEYWHEGSRYRMWIEDAPSVSLKSSLAIKYGCAGTASWKRMDADGEVWAVLGRNLKDCGGYLSWLLREGPGEVVGSAARKGGG
ncbi:MAG: glycosyl hydrolase family 18 protein, partial [Oscillospiraceae bacterium]|nr:glycosyl hydrolase family 18 protein [Oscillospiraceae bacterium]